MDKKIIIAIVVIAVLAVGGYVVYTNLNQPEAEVIKEQTEQAPTTNQDQSNVGGISVEVTTSKTYEVTLADSGFTPATLTIKAGDTVTFKNQSSAGMWVASAMHPEHMAYSGTSLLTHCPDPSNTSFDQCTSVGAGGSWSFTFNKVGSWGYHNHVVTGQFGKIVVE